MGEVLAKLGKAEGVTCFIWPLKNSLTDGGTSCLFQPFNKPFGGSSLGSRGLRVFRREGENKEICPGCLCQVVQTETSQQIESIKKI